MKPLSRYVVLVVLVLLFGCQQQQASLTEGEKETIKKEVKGQFDGLISAVNGLDAEAWSRFYSKDEFVSAIAGTDFHASRDQWVGVITKFFSTRERQRLEPLQVRVTPLTPVLALMTSEEKTEMDLKDGVKIRAKHAFTMVWKKEKDGWKILHSHESWTDEPAREAPAGETGK